MALCLLLSRCLSQASVKMAYDCGVTVMTNIIMVTTESCK